MSWAKVINLELEVAKIIRKQEENGVKFDLDKAKTYVVQLEDMKGTLYDQIRPYLRAEINNPYPKPIEEPFKLNGDYRDTVVKWFGDDAHIVRGAFTRITITEPDLGSRQKLIKQLLSFGWKPEEFTDKGFPKLTDKGEPVASLFRIKAPIGRQIAEWYVLTHRQSQIVGWIKRIRADGRLTAAANTCGTNTGRMRHKIVVNVPKASDKVVFGYQMRDLFIADEGFLLCGHDASGLEARMMGHYTTPLDDGWFANELLNGDIHSKNAKIFFAKELAGKERGDEGFEGYRDLAKTVFYALIYGAQAKKISSIFGCNTKEAQIIIDEFWEANGGLGKLRKKVIAMADRWGYVPGLDGRKVYIRSSHSSMNALFQSGGAIVMKVAMVILAHWIERANLEVRKVIDMHDESQSEIPVSDIFTFQGTSVESLLSESTGRIITKPHAVEGGFESYYCKYGELAVKSIRKAGEMLNLRCALDAEYKIGRSWAETH